PGRPFLFTIPATGARPMTFRAEGLPPGLVLDEATGRITGAIARPGTHEVVLHASNARGAATRSLRIQVGDTICLTPPLGWNSWNCWAHAVDDGKIRATARAMVEKGLIHHGWTYMNIDDCWQGVRGGALGALQPNEKFPDMKALADFVHGLGLKLGIYSTPWITSYAGFCGGSSDREDGAWDKALHGKDRRHGKFKFDRNDAAQWAAWGIDYLKYDWGPNELESMERMAAALEGCGRDIVYSLSNTAPIALAEALGRRANLWRTTGDIRDGWDFGQSDGRGAQGIRDIWRYHGRWAKFQGPGHWNDADMLVVGKVGWGALRPTNLSGDEQYVHISLWCLWSAPMLLGCPVEELDDFTLSLLTNDEVLALHQDSLGLQAAAVAGDEASEVLAKKLEDGSLAVGLFNLGLLPAEVEVRWPALGLSGPQRVRDLWRQRDVGRFADRFAATVPGHGVVLVRMSPPE
ncbi:MAG: alpha-galactosidase, partial [Planctomycetes bacterium]|nr:alpha-galactosidase [Planctomycetota bacterium]